MGMIGSILGLLFGGGRNVVAETYGAFRPNAEAEAKRTATYQGSALQQFSSEFYQPKSNWFDSLINAMNRLPRPLMALGTIGLFVSAMASPIWFSERMQGLALVPDQLWWLLGAIVTFYFGARYQAKAIDAKAIMNRTPQVIKNIQKLRGLDANSPNIASSGTDSEATLDIVKSGDNAAVDDWKSGAGDR